MSDKAFLTYQDLADRWGCTPSSLRNARPEDLPARLKRPGSRLVLFPLSEVIAFEKANTEPRDYAAERDLGLSQRLVGINRPKGRRS